MVRTTLDLDNRWDVLWAAFYDLPTFLAWILVMYSNKRNASDFIDALVFPYNQISLFNYSQWRHLITYSDLFVNQKSGVLANVWSNKLPTEKKPYRPTIIDFLFSIVRYEFYISLDPQQFYRFLKSTFTCTWTCAVKAALCWTVLQSTALICSVLLFTTLKLLAIYSRMCKFFLLL